MSKTYYKKIELQPLLINIKMFKQELNITTLNVLFEARTMTLFFRTYLSNL